MFQESRLRHPALTFAVLTWLVLSALVWFDASERDNGRWQWGLVVAATGFLGFAAYVLFAVSPPEPR
jgi:hypothetical protein